MAKPSTRPSNRQRKPRASRETERFRSKWQSAARVCRQSGCRKSGESGSFREYWPFPPGLADAPSTRSAQSLAVGRSGSANRFRTQCRLVNSLIPLSPPEKGHIAFGMVAFPVKLHAAARSQAVSFNQLHQCDHSRVKQVLYCQAEDQPVSRHELVKGYEYEKDRYVVVEDGELAQITPRSSRVMEEIGRAHA